MASSTTQIANFAIANLGIGKQISNLETDRSQEANACRQFYETARDMVLRDYAWSFASKIVTLGLVEEEPNDEWGFSYRYPSDCLEFKRILSGIRNDANDTRVPYKISSDDEGRLILTDMEDAQAEYTSRVEDVLLFPSDFVIALSYRLAMYMAPLITAGDQFKMAERLTQNYQAHIAMARQNAANEEQPDPLPDSEFIRARD